MSQSTSSGGLGSLLGLLAIGLIVAGLIWAYNDSKEEPQKEPAKLKVVEKQTPATTDDISNLLGVGDGTLGSSTVKASDLGKATSISGGVKVGGSSRSGSRRSSRSSSRSSRRSGG